MTQGMEAAMPHRDHRWLAAVVVSAAIAITLDLMGPSWHVAYGVMKALTTILLIAWAWRRPEPDSVYRRWVLIGLLFSLGGDVALLSADGFIVGLVSFLIAHLAYLRAFLHRGRGFLRPWWPLLPLIAYAAVMMTAMWPHLPGGLRGPVVGYMLALVLMAAQAASTWRATGSRHAYRAAIGALLFVASDSLLAWNRFVSPLPVSSLLVLATYWGSLIGIVRSLRGWGDAGRVSPR